jgi:hypothetical protein
MRGRFMWAGDILMRTWSDEAARRLRARAARDVRFTARTTVRAPN